VSATREDVVRESLGWLGTPFHDCSGVKGAGVDCAHLILRCFAAVGKTPDVPIKPYRPQWFLHRKEPLFLQELQARGAQPISIADALPADVLMYNFGIHAAHGAIVIDANTIIHAYKPARCVCLGSRREFAAKFDSAWSLFL
jgi:cell wall-associated NlpC family hydrolase